MYLLPETELERIGKNLYRKFPKITDIKSGVRFAIENEISNFVAMTKLHGSNIGLVYDVEKNSWHLQSRNKPISVDDDLHGAAKFLQNDLKSVLEIWSEEFQKESVERDSRFFAVYGEIVGKGIQKGTAINTVDGKYFYPFHVSVVENPDASNYKFFERIVRAGSEADASGYLNMFLIPDAIYHLDSFSIGNQHLFSSKIHELAANTSDICPVAKYLGVYGKGEGVVVRPEHDFYDAFAFKAVGDDFRERVSQRRTPKLQSQEDLEEFQDASTFATECCQTARFEKAIAYMEEMGYDIVPQNTKVFLQRVCSDIIEEEGIPQGVSERMLNKVVCSISSRWYKNYLQEI